MGNCAYFILIGICRFCANETDRFVGNTAKLCSLINSH